MPLSKDELIADLRDENRRLLEMLQTTLKGLRDTEAELATYRTADQERRGRNAERQRNRRLSRDSHATRTATVTQQSQHVSRNSHATVTQQSRDSSVTEGENHIGEGETFSPLPEDPLDPEEKLGKENGGSAEGGSRDSSVTVTLHDSDSDWLAFRETYPKTHRTSWAVSERRFLALNRRDRAAALKGAAKYADQCPGEYTKGAQSWLLERRWETVDDVPSANGHKLEEDYHPTKVVV